MAGTTAALILATQQFDRHPAFDDPDIDVFVVIESARRFDALPYHRHKIVLLVSAMRHTVERLRDRDRHVVHVTLDRDLGFTDALTDVIAEHGITRLAWMSATDRGVDDRIGRLCDARGVGTRRYPDALFLTPADESDRWFAEHPRAAMEDFYRWQRRRTGILMDGARPAGGRWNFDTDNRQPLPADGLVIPSIGVVRPDAITEQVIADVALRYPDHPGDPEGFWLPVTPEGAREHLDRFVHERLSSFGPYEDAMSADEPFLFHSVLSPLMNIGLLTVDEIVAAATSDPSAPIASVEGFVRQVIGWREYMRGMYRAHPELERVNALRLERPLPAWWYTGSDRPDDLPVPVARVLDRVLEWGYAHHIERLMVLGNWFLLQGHAPREVYRWFLALFVDAYPWVMVPNVMGMSQYADGGLVGTKPYVSGGAYLQKMGRWWSSGREARESEFTAAYWRFLDAHEALLADNPRMSLPLAQMRRRREQT